MNDAPLFWNLARASGFVAYGLLAVTMLLGLSVKTRVLGRLMKPATVVDTHRVLSLLALGMIALHGVVLVLDPVVEISPLDVAVPGLVGYRPVWVAFGIVAAYLAVTVHASFSLRKRIGSKNWRRLHWLTYAVFLSGTVHGIASGTDSTEGWALAIYGVLVGAVVGGTAWRAMAAKASAAAKTVGVLKEPVPAATPATSRRLGPAALLIVAFAGVAAAGVLANITLLDAARAPHGPVGNLGPLGPISTSSPPAPATTTSPPAARTPRPAIPAPPPANATAPAATTRPSSGQTTSDDEHEIEGAADDD